MTRFDHAATALNALWLHGSPGWSRALVVDEDPDRGRAVAEVLEHHLCEVRLVPSALARAPEHATPFEQETWDLIWLGGKSLVDGRDRSRVKQTLARCGGAVAPGGGILCLTENPWYWGGYESGIGSRLGRLGRAMLKAVDRRTAPKAFPDARSLLEGAGVELRGCYYLDWDTPRSSSVIPISRPAARAYELRFRATGSSTTRKVRQRLASCGFHPLLYSSFARVGIRTDPPREDGGSKLTPRSSREGWLIDAITKLDPPGLESVSASGVILLKNRSLLPFSERRRTPSRTGRGFNAVILDSGGRPTYYAKCRAAEHEGSAREAALVKAASDDPELARTIPCSWTIESSGIRLILSEYLNGETLQTALGTMRPEALAPMLTEILDRCDQLRAAIPAPDSPSSDPVSLFERARPTLERIGRTPHGDPRTLATLEAALERAGEVDHLDQHGDLWPQNIVRSGGRWWLLDFEAYGTITVPLFDTMQLTRNTLQVLGPIIGGQVERGARSLDPVAFDELRELVADRASQLNLDSAAVRGVLAYFAASTLARHADDPRTAPARASAAALLRATSVALARSGPGGRSIDVIDVFAPGAAGARPEQ